MTAPDPDPPPPTAPLHVLRVFYFLNFGGLGALFPFLPLLFSARGLTTTQISWVMSLIPLSNLFMPPLWGTIADALHARVVLLRLASFASGLTALLLLPDWGFGGAALGLGIFTLFRSPLPSLADAATSAAMGTRQVGFGRVRVWGSFGFALCVLIIGWLDGSHRPAVLFGVTCVIYVLSAVVTFGLRTPPLQREHGIVREALRHVTRPAMLLLLAGNVSYYFGHAIYDGFFSLRLRQLRFGDGFISHAWAIGVAAEIGVMFLAPRLLQRWRASTLLVLSAACAIGRWVGLSHAEAPWAVLALQTLHGVTFGLWYLSLVRHVQAIAPERLRASLQSIALSMFGLGSILGYLIAGRVFERFGSGRAFLLAAAGAAVALLLYLAVRLLDGRARAAIT
jgi:MFS transporter, PPP family, 3-phenylpropionic acid transporter